MWIRTQDTSGGVNQFFRLGIGHESLSNYYKTNFALMQYHKYRLSELEQMIPWERDVYLVLLLQHLEEEKQKLEELKKR